MITAAVSARSNRPGPAREQAGVLSRRQALDVGMTPDQIQARLQSGRWQRLGTGTYATFDGPVHDEARVWAALLVVGPRAVAGPRTTLWLAGLADRLPDVLDVDVPATRQRRAAIAQVRVRRRRDLDRVTHPAAAPPRLRIEEAVLDAAAAQTRPEPVIDLVLRAVQRRVTTADRLRAGLDLRRAHRWRRLLEDLLGDARDGVTSPLERRWLRDVERRHGLPPSRMNRRDVDGSRRCYRDVEFEWGLVRELDGHEAHPDDARFRDRRRDNRVTVSGRRTLRYGWREIAGDPCGVAAETARTCDLESVRDLDLLHRVGLLVRCSCRCLCRRRRWVLRQRQLPKGGSQVGRGGDDLVHRLRPRLSDRRDQPTDGADATLRRLPRGCVIPTRRCSRPEGTVPCRSAVPCRTTVVGGAGLGQGLQQSNRLLGHPGRAFPAALTAPTAPAALTATGGLTVPVHGALHSAGSGRKRTRRAPSRNAAEVTTHRRNALGSASIRR
jgi:ribosomal protein S30